MRKSVVVSALVALGTCLSTAAPAASAPSVAAPSAEAVRTVFIGDSYTANFGIGPVGTTPALCFRATDNYPAVAVDELAQEGVPLDVQADVSCGGAQIHHVWEPQDLLQGAAEPQKNALRPDTQLVVGSLGGNTVGFARIMKQCSERLRGSEGTLLPADPVDEDSPASGCSDFFQNGAGADWLDERFLTVERDLRRMLSEIHEAAPGADTVLVGYPRIVPEDTSACLEPIPGGTEKPLADIEEDALKFLDKEVQEPLNDLMEREAQAAGASFVDIYHQTGTHTACGGEQRGVGAMLERSEVRFLGLPLPWYVHPNRTGRDLQAELVAETIKQITTA
ncbi:SGNH/GDSL hydrolase family protein [Streptomyces sparsogenes]|uniref:SGNH/GDSL hydrolase family protein n=1 Tax=Streptomyces sparsogenes TaxID=67365 RepID=UPI0033C56B26